MCVDGVFGIGECLVWVLADTACIDFFSRYLRCARSFYGLGAWAGCMGGLGAWMGWVHGLGAWMGWVNGMGG